MKLSIYAAFIIFILLFAPIANAQVAVKKTPSEDAEKLKKEAVAFLRETMADVNNLRTLENRISFAAEMASLMWFHDEKEARSMYVTAIGDFKELLLQYDARMNSMASENDADVYSGGIFGDVSDRSRLTRRFQTAMQVRQQIAMSLAEHDAELAFSFYYESLGTISNVEFRKQMESRDTYFEHQLMTQVAESNAEKAAQFGKKSLAKGLNYQHVELLKKIYAKDVDKGIDFGAAILSKMKSEELKLSDFYIASNLLDYGGGSLERSKKEGGKKPVYSQQDLRDLAELLAQGVLRSDSEEEASGMQYVTAIEKYSPSRAAQIRARSKGRNSNRNSMSYSANAMNSASNAIGYGGAYASNSNSNYSPYQKELEDRLKDEENLKNDVESLGSAALPKEEREKIIDQARKILMRTPGRDKKIMGLSMLAKQVSSAGDKELAADIMKDALNLINPQPKNYQDFMLTWMLAAGYAEADPEKAFPLLEDTIYRVNDTIAAFVKVGEFIDAAGVMIQDGEVQVGVFGGSMVRGLTSELGMADATLRALAKNDFTKTKNLTSRFDRSEVRILAKMMILRAVLGDGKDKNRDIEMDGLIPTQPIVQH
ncbi:MAG: hypothetical protein H7070_17080 [Saprospiraceae bacterium]|nr:hypothetical protein [Pyrinomonadaceae bacterium]